MQEVKAFPYTDRGRRFEAVQFMEQNLQLIEQGFTGQEIMDKICLWLGDGRAGLLTTRRSPTEVVVREILDGLLQLRHYSKDGFPYHVLVPMSLDEWKAALKKAAGKKKKGDGSHATASEGSEEDEELEEEGGGEGELGGQQLGDAKQWQVYPFKKIPVYTVLNSSEWTRRFDRVVFDPHPEALYAAASAFSLPGTPSANVGLSPRNIGQPRYVHYSPGARTLNSFTHFRWLPLELQAMADELRSDAAVKRADVLDFHVTQIACRGDPDREAYVKKWFAHVYLRPWEPLHTMLLLVGSQGCGKSGFMEIFGPIFGIHYRYVGDLRDVVGNYTGTAKDASLLFINEAKVKRGSKEEGKLKGLITDHNRALRVREMRKDVEYVDSYVHVAAAVDMLSWFQMDLKGRRVATVHFSDEKVGEDEYFIELHRSIKDDDWLGLRAYLFRLITTVDLSGFGRGALPKEERERALRTIEEEMRPFDPIKIFLGKCLDRGFILAPRLLNDNWPGLNEGVRWRDSRGRTKKTRKYAWVSEVQSLQVYEQMQRDVAELKSMLEAELLQGLRPYLRDPNAKRRDVTWKESQGGRLFDVKGKKSYLCFSPPEEIAKLLCVPYEEKSCHGDKRRTADEPDEVHQHPVKRFRIEEEHDGPSPAGSEDADNSDEEPVRTSQQEFLPVRTTGAKAISPQGARDAMQGDIGKEKDKEKEKETEKEEDVGEKEYTRFLRQTGLTDSADSWLAFEQDTRDKLLAFRAQRLASVTNRPGLMAEWLREAEDRRIEREFDSLGILPCSGQSAGRRTGFLHDGNNNNAPMEPLGNTAPDAEAVSGEVEALRPSGQSLPADVVGDGDCHAEQQQRCDQQRCELVHKGVGDQGARL